MSRLAQRRQYLAHEALVRLLDRGGATGRIDLVHREDGGLVVPDWKSDSVGPAHAVAAADVHRRCYFCGANVTFQAGRVHAVRTRFGSMGVLGLEELSPMASRPSSGEAQPRP